jgi:transcriptional regulator with XRE-family HTH domain
MNGVVTVPADPGKSLTALIGRNIKLARALAGMTQIDVVEAQSLAEGERAFEAKDLSWWENGHRRPREATLARIGGIVGQDLSWFYVPHPEHPEV